MIYEYRVIFGDTDQMGVVYYGNYMRIFEGARAEYWRSLGRSYKDLEEARVAMPVVEAHCKYKRPALYEDILKVETEVTEMRGASMRFGYVIRRDATEIAHGFTRHAVIDTTGMPIRIPEFMRQLVKVVPAIK